MSQVDPQPKGIGDETTVAIIPVTSTTESQVDPQPKGIGDSGGCLDAKSFNYVPSGPL